VGHAEPAIGPRRFTVQAETSALYCLLGHRTRKLRGHWSFPYAGDAGRSAKLGNLARDNRGVAQPGRALRLGRRCRRFKSCHPDQFYKGWEVFRRSRAEMASTGAWFGSRGSGGSNPSAPTIPKKGGTVGPVSYIIIGTPDDGCGTEHGLAAMRSAL
jgi:hypothetical protein